MQQNNPNTDNANLDQVDVQSASIKPADLEEFKDDQSIIEDGKE